MSISDTISGLTDWQCWLFAKVNTVHQNIINFDMTGRTKYEGLIKIKCCVQTCLNNYLIM